MVLEARDRIGGRLHTVDLAGSTGRSGRVVDPEVQASLGVQYQAFPDAVGRLLGELGADASAADGIKAFVGSAGPGQAEARRARQALHAIVEAESADLAERQSLRWMWNEFEYGGDYFGDIPEGGYQSLVDAPELPTERLAAIERLGFGRYEKVALALTSRSGAALASRT